MARAPALQEIEASPEADRLDGFPHPRQTRSVIGHDVAQQMLAEGVRSGRLHHGWLFTGPEGIGKATLGYALARHLLARPDERDAAAASLVIPVSSIAYRQVTALSHPDLLVLRRPWDPKTKRQTSTIPVDEVRRLRMFLGHKAEAASWRVVLVDAADDLNASAANACKERGDTCHRRCWLSSRCCRRTPLSDAVPVAAVSPGRRTSSG